MSAGPTAVAIVVAGGWGARFGSPEGKQLAPVAGRPLLAWSVEACAGVDGVDLVVLVCPEERAGEYLSAGSVAEGTARVVAAASGPTRRDSVAAGLACVPADTEFVVVHDGARPLVRKVDIVRAITRLAEDPSLDGVVMGHPSVDTVKVVDEGLVTETPDRDRLWAVQTPQVFRKGALERAHDAARRQGFLGTDDASLVEREGGRVAVLEGPRDNIKVTVAEDIIFAEAVLTRRLEERP